MLISSTLSGKVVYSDGALMNTRRRLIIMLGGNVKKATLGKQLSITGPLVAIVLNAAINLREMKFVF